jgi:uncharacterized protein YdhG (YjbR/CyaY superfamily)
MDKRPKKAPAGIDDYLSRLTSDKRAALETLRRTIRSVIPAAEECISYGIPAFRWNGRVLVFFHAATNHCSFFPGAFPIELHKADLAGYKTSKGTVRFAVDKPLPATLVKKLVKARMVEFALKKPVKKKSVKKKRT